MKGFFKTNTFKVMLIIVMILLIIIIYTAAAGGSFLSDSLGFVTTPMQKISVAATDGVGEFLNLDALSTEELKEMVEELSTENSEYRKMLVDYYDMEQEYDQLRILLEIQEENKDVKQLPASVIQRDPSDVFYGFAIDKGSLAGVSVGDPVITSQGLVGVVSEVYATTSMVTSLYSEEVKVAALSKELDENGVISSNIYMAASGTLRMNYLKNDTKVHEGSIITTSGAGGNFPKDLVIGYVASIEQSENDISKYATIQPYEDIKNVKDVFVIYGFPGKDAEGPDIDIENPGTDEDPEAQK